MSTSPKFEDYVELFGAEPVSVDAKGWYYGTEFLVKRGLDELHVTIAPDEAELDLLWTQDGRRRMALGLRMVVGWRIERPGASAHLIVKVNTGPNSVVGFDYCLVRIDPQIEIDCQMTWGRGWDPVANPADGFGPG